jgi:hypothetical protein
MCGEASLPELRSLSTRAWVVGLAREETELAQKVHLVEEQVL